MCGDEIKTIQPAYSLGKHANQPSAESCCISPVLPHAKRPLRVFLVVLCLLFSSFAGFCEDVGAACAYVRMSRVRVDVRGSLPAAFAFFEFADGDGNFDVSFIVGYCVFRSAFGAFYEFGLGYDAEICKFLFHSFEDIVSFAFCVDGDFSVERVADGLCLAGFFEGFGDDASDCEAFLPFFIER